MKKWKSMASILEWLHFLLIFSTHAKAVAQGEDHRTRLAVWRDLEWEKCCHPPVFEQQRHAPREKWHEVVYGRVVETTSHLNNGGKFSLQGIQAIDVPILVSNLPHKKERRARTEDILSAVGFTSVSFPSVLDLNEVRAGVIPEDFLSEYILDRPGSSPSFEGRDMPDKHLPYIANTMTMLSWMKKAMDLGLAMFGIFEDDLVPGMSPRATNSMIVGALRELPSTADLLFLEFCYETCTSMSAVSGAPHLLRMHAPFCSGAIIYTAKGAKKVLERTLPAFFIALDTMLAQLIRHGHLEAYSVNSVAFFQDGKALKEGVVSTTHGGINDITNPLVSLYGASGLHFPLHHICVEKGDEHQKFYELFSIGYVRREASDYVVSVRDLHVYSWAKVTNGLVHVELLGDEGDDQGTFELCDAGRYRVERDDGDLIELRVPEDSPCNPERPAWYLNLHLTDSTWEDEMPVVVPWVLFLRPEDDRRRCGLLPPESGMSITRGASAHHHDPPGMGWGRGGAGGVFEDEEAPDRNRLAWPLGEGVGCEPVPSLACNGAGEFYVSGGSCMAKEQSLAFVVNTSSILIDTLSPLLNYTMPLAVRSCHSSPARTAMGLLNENNRDGEDLQGRLRKSRCVIENHVLINTQGGAGASDFMNMIARIPYIISNHAKDVDGLKHQPATFFGHDKHNIYIPHTSIPCATIPGELVCFSRVLIILGDPLHSIESVHRRFGLGHMNKWRQYNHSVPYMDNVDNLSTIYSTLNSTGYDSTGISHYITSWLQASVSADWPEMRLVTTEILYNYATDFARFLGVEEKDMAAFKGLKYLPKPFVTNASSGVISMFDRLKRQIDEYVHIPDNAARQRHSADVPQYWCGEHERPDHSHENSHDEGGPDEMGQR